MSGLTGTGRESLLSARTRAREPLPCNAGKPRQTRGGPPITNAGHGPRAPDYVVGGNRALRRPSATCRERRRRGVDTAACVREQQRDRLEIGCCSRACNFADPASRWAVGPESAGVADPAERRNEKGPPARCAETRVPVQQDQTSRPASPAAWVRQGSGLGCGGSSERAAARGESCDRGAEDEGG